MKHDLLNENLLSWRALDRRRGATTLPGLLARLGDRTLADFPRVRAHQFHPWCMFLTQLAAIALHRSGGTDPRLPEAEWRERLLSLTAGSREPWNLVVEDLSQPAFFQPPVPERTIEGWQVEPSPDDIDVLVTAKNYDVKASQLHDADPEFWVYSIATLQTTQGYPGRGYNRVARMKSGLGNRPRVGLTEGHSPGNRFVRDVGVLLRQWPELLERGFSERGCALVWLEPWTGGESLATGDLSPHYIEVCWRLRLLQRGKGLACGYTTTAARRCQPEIENGDVGDPWIPVERRGGGALTVGGRGFDYRLLTRVLFENDFAPAAAQQAANGDSDRMLFAASALVRGQGKTDGLNERSIPIPPQVRFKLERPAERKALADRASSRVQMADLMRQKVLFPALRCLPGGGDGDQFDEQVDLVFFEHLFASASSDDQQARLEFDAFLEGVARGELQRAIDGRRGRDVTDFRHITHAERAFDGSLARHFADLVKRRTAVGIGGNDDE